MTYEVKLDVFEGPFQLLLTLIADQRLDVCDVPIARLTEDYLAHIERLERTNLDVTTEFLVVAATLLALKAKALLPSTADEGRQLEDEVERDLLIARLLEVQTFRSAGQLLADLLAAGDKRFPAKASPDDDALRSFPALEGMSAADLARTLIAVVRDTLRTVDTSKVVVDQVSTQEASVELVQRLDAGPLRFGDIARGRNLAWTVALFLAMLELAMRGEIDLGDGITVGDLQLTLRKAG